MSTTRLSDVTAQVQKFWAPMFVPKLKEDSILPGLVNRAYEGEIKKKNDTVYVSALARPTAVIKDTSAADADVFSTEKMTTTRVPIVANKRITAAYEVEDLVDIQSLVGANESAVRNGLFEALQIKLNAFCYGIVSPSTSAPDHTVASVTDFNASQIGVVRKLASQAKWPKLDAWYLLLDPQYYSDFINATTMTSSDYVGGDLPVVRGQFAQKRFNFNILEDNSDGLIGIGTSGQDAALAFHPDFMYLVMQQQPTLKISDLHSHKQHGYVVSADLIVGAVLGIEGNVKHITVINT